MDSANRRITLSVKALEIAEEKAQMAEYGSSDSGASLGDILGAAFKAKAEEAVGGEADEADEAPKVAAEAESEAETPAEAAAEETVDDDAEKEAGA